MADMTLGGGVVVEVAAPTQPTITMAPPVPSAHLVVPIGGPPGSRGVGIVSILRTAGDGTAGTIDTYTVTLTDTSTYTFQVANGADGSVGPANELTVGTVSTGAPGSAVQFTITGTPPNQTVDVTIPAGDKGDIGSSISSVLRTSGDGTAGTTDTYTITMTDASTQTFTVTNGSLGDDGVGINSITLEATSGRTKTYRIAFTDGSHFDFDVTNGADSTVPGPANTLTAGTVTTLSPGTSATASVTGTSPNQTLKLGIPQGRRGDAGEDSTVAGPPGEPGEQGEPGSVATGVMVVVTHGTTAGTARPTADAVYWIGSVEPTNMQNYDMWINPTETP